MRTLKTIPFAPGVRLPADLVTQRIGLLAVSGAGKSNTGAVLCEEMHRGGLPFAVIDIKGDYWGLRSSRDGKGPGIPIPIFGGEHCDVPLERNGGALMADLLLEEGISCIIDVSEFEDDVDTEDAQVEFLTDFARRLYARSKRPSAKVPIHLILEEAEVFLPQKPANRKYTRCLNAWGHIVRRGRSRGIGATIVTQRSALISKDMLTQCNTLIVMRTPAPNDRKPIKEWVDAKGVDPEMMESLPSLEDGEAWIWSPRWLKVFKRVQFRRRETFDSGAAPEFTRKRRRPPTLADIDLPSIRERMSETIEREKQRDPKALQAEVARLKRELASARHSIETAPPATFTVEVPMLTAADRKMITAKAEETRIATAEALEAIGRLQKAANDMIKAGAPLTRVESLMKAPVLASAPARPTGASTAPREPVRRPTAAQDPKNGDGTLHPTAIRILQEIARAHPLRLTKSQVGLVSNLTVTGGSFQGHFGKLRALHLISLDGKEIGITPGGLEYLGADVPIAPRTVAEVQAMWRARLDSGPARLYDTLIAVYPAGLSKKELASQVQMTSTGGSFQGHIGTLRRNGLLEVKDGQIFAGEDLFKVGVA